MLHNISDTIQRIIHKIDRIQVASVVVALVQSVTTPHTFLMLQNRLHVEKPQKRVF